MEFQRGDKCKYYILTKDKRRSMKTEVKECTVVQEFDKHITVQFKNYTGSVLKSLLLTGEQRLEKVSYCA